MGNKLINWICIMSKLVLIPLSWTHVPLSSVV
jgi:hypothetical protein